MAELADVVVVGAGTAGLCVAIEAARCGMRVELVESTNEVGGTLPVSAGHMSAAGTRLQKRLGIDDHPDLHFADVMRIGGGVADPQLVRLAVDEAPGTVDWLDEQGFAFADGAPTIYRGHSPYSRPRTYWGEKHGMSILEVLARELNDQIAQDRIGLRLSTRMTGLVTRAGRVSGVAVTGVDGTEEVAAGVTVLASGGYGSNSKLFAEFTPSSPRLVTNAVPAAMGDGIVAARALGARVRFGEHHTPRLGLLESRRSLGRVDFWNGMLDLTPGTREVCEIWVNVAGQRFVPEDSEDVTQLEHAVLRQEGAQFWLILDSAGLETMGSPVRQWDVERFVEEAAHGDFVWEADDIPTLAARAGIDAAGLQSSVRQYNAADRKRDEFGRSQFGAVLDQSPFYAVRTPAAVLCSFGGLDVDKRFQVLCADGAAIPGLHAVGEVIGMGATSGAAFCGGMSVTPALAFGRLLGRRLGGAAD